MLSGHRAARQGKHQSWEDEVFWEPWDWRKGLNLQFVQNHPSCPEDVPTAGHVATACPVLLGKLTPRRRGARPCPSHACSRVTACSSPVRYAPLLEPLCSRDASLAQGHIHSKWQCWDPKKAPDACLTGFRALLHLGECLVCNP